ncbi:MAG: cocE [Sphingomonas bacterium]|uniref:CocE/NonD family hydrolase n=1 Tax=Sphingomonas bacterium TaxID=1895847 RepID=UPI002612E60A|nr:CocE/NonD family hydrolase [Sphingomonas bacterium]MDB5711802.1 cocE [Sphingomonas bacterium]
MIAENGRDVMVAMRDGIRLATDIYLPEAALRGERVPVLLERTPYDKRGTNHGDRTLIDPMPVSKPEIAAQFVAAGYAYVLQDCRGRFASEGSFTKYLNEAEDGYDTLAWLVDQPWCNGRIGTLGLSYCAHVQAALAGLDPPGLAAMFLDCGGFSSAYHNGIRQGGAFELKQLTWAYSQAIEAGDGDAERHAAIAAENIGQWVRVMPWRRGHSPVSAAPEYEDYVVEQWEHDRFSPFWQQRGIYWRGSYAETADVPMVHLSGWYDPYSITAIENFTALSALKKGPVKLVLGPWTHGQRSVSFAGDVDFGAEAPLDGNLAGNYVALRRDWFDRHLKGLDAPEHLAAPVRLFVMGGGSGRRDAAGRLDHGGRWRDETAWPLPSTVPTTFHLHPGGQLAAEPAEPGILSYDFDPADPVPTIGGAVTSGAPVMAAGAYDQRETAGLFGARHPGRALSERPDILVFETEPLAQDIELTGQVVARLFVSSSCVDTDFTIKLIDVYPPSTDYPDGFAMNLAHGILRARFRHSFEQPEPMTPGSVQRIEISAFPTSNLFVAGHRIRVEISSSNFPHFDINQNVDWRVPGAEPQVARNSVHLGAATPSRLILPVIPPGR